MFEPRARAAKGRAAEARPFLVLALLATLLALAAPANAAAALFPPILQQTNPASPGASITPRIQGRLEEVVSKVVWKDLRSFSRPIASGSLQENTVTVYAQSGCNGPIVAEGSVGELEGVGIQVTVAAESTTTFYAKEGDGLEESPCSSNGLTYRQVSSAPGAPVFTSVNPASPANYNFPYLVGTADPDATVSIYTASGCTGTAVASGSGALFAVPGIQVAVPDNSETTFYAKATLGGFASGCTTEPIVYREVTPPPAEPPPPGGSGNGGGAVIPATPPPAPHLRTVPGGTANDNTPLLTGTAEGAGTVRVFAGALCAGAPVAKGPASQFTGPGLEVQVIDNVVAVFTAISVSPSGRESACSAPVVYVEDSTAPHTRITMGPAAKTAKRKVVFRFADTTGNPTGTTFFCKVDRRKWKRCSSPLSLPHLHLKSYVLRVRATDAAGNVETKGTQRRFRVVAHP